MTEDLKGSEEGNALKAKLITNEQLVENEGFHEKSYRETNWRWAALIFATATMIGSYYCFDNP